MDLNKLPGGALIDVLRSRKRPSLATWSSLEERELCQRLEETAGVAGREQEYAELKKLWNEVHDANQRGESAEFVSELYASHAFQRREPSEPT